MDSAASAQKPQAVLAAMESFAGQRYANVHRGVYALADTATRAYEAARERTRAFLGAADAREIVLTTGGTDSLNLVARGLGARWSAGDAVALSLAEHHSNITPWHMLAERCGVEVRWIETLADGALDLASLARVLDDGRVRLVSLAHMSNVLGSVLPQAAIAMARDAGALVLLDGCQAAVHMPIDVQALDCDFYALTGHKLYGPTGIGALYGRYDLLAGMAPVRGGGEMIREVSRERSTFLDPPQRFEAGTPPIIEAVGLAAAMDWLDGLDRAALARHEAALERKARVGAQALDIRPLGETADKGAIFSFACDWAHPHDLAEILDRFGVCIRAGHHCAAPLHTSFGLTASARASFGAYNDEDDVEALLEGLAAARRIFA